MVEGVVGPGRDVEESLRRFDELLKVLDFIIAKDYPVRDEALAGLWGGEVGGRGFGARNVLP